MGRTGEEEMVEVALEEVEREVEGKEEVAKEGEKMVVVAKVEVTKVEVNLEVVV